SKVLSERHTDRAAESGRSGHAEEMGIMLLGQQARRQLVAVHTRKPDVDEDEVGTTIAIELDRQVGLVDDVDEMIPVLEEHRDSVGRIPVVVDDQDRQRLARSRGMRRVTISRLPIHAWLSHLQTMSSTARWRATAVPRRLPFTSSPPFGCNTCPVMSAESW